ncbi:MAG: hypothetical protein AMXMBFR6_22720 [Betaproteobacteria bacterium]
MSRSLTGLVLASTLAALHAGTASAQFLGNFDAVNTTGHVAHGFEIELEGLDVSDITDTFGGLNRGFPTTVERYGAPSVLPYVNGAISGVRVTYQATYDANTGRWLAPGGTFENLAISIGTPSATTFQTPGDNCWSGGGIGYGAGTPCDHFGVGTTRNPTKTTYSWLTEDPAAPGVLSKTVATLPAPSWSVVFQPPPPPPAPNEPPPPPPPPPVVKAVIEAPELPDPVNGEPQFGTAIWVKVFTTELEQPEGLEGLMRGNLLNHGLALERRADGTEIEWQLLQRDPGNPAAGMLELGGDVLNPNAEAVVRRYEFYEYLGVYKQSDHEAQPLLGDSHADPSEIGAFLGAQNAQAMLAAVPEPSTLATMLVGLGLIGFLSRRRTRTGA